MKSTTRWTIAAAVALAAITAAGACEDHAKAADAGTPCCAHGKAEDAGTKAVAEGMPCCDHGKTAGAAAPVAAAHANGTVAGAPCEGTKQAVHAKDGSPAPAVPASVTTAGAPCAAKSGCAKKAAAVAKDQPAKDATPADAGASAGAHR
jgi:hypothetical protein